MTDTNEFAALGERLETYRDCLQMTLVDKDVDTIIRALKLASEQAAEIAELRGALGLALKYWADRQQRYKKRHPVWVQNAQALLAKGSTDGQ